MERAIKIALILLAITTLVALGLIALEPIFDGLATVVPLFKSALLVVTPPLKFGRACLNLLTGSSVVSDLVIFLALVFPMTIHELERSSAIWQLLTK